MFIRKQGKTKFMYFGSTASEEIAEGAVVALASGRIIKAANDTSPATIVGVIRHAITSSDDEYLTVNTPVEVEVAVERFVVWEADVLSTNALTNTDQGTYMDLTTADTGLEVDTNVSTLDTCFCVGYISATKGLFVLNHGPDYFDAT
jgi:hypothetical protein